MWLRHLVMVAAGQSDVMRVNYDYIRAFMAQWGSKVLLTGMCDVSDQIKKTLSTAVRQANITYGLTVEEN